MDVNTNAYRIVKELTEGKKPLAKGKAGGVIGGKARAAKLSAERRREIAMIASNSRWKADEKKQKGEHGATRQAS